MRFFESASEVVVMDLPFTIQVVARTVTPISAQWHQDNNPVPQHDQLRTNIIIEILLDYRIRL